MKKRGQMEISFGMIFSIIIIIATLAVGFYVLRSFMNLSNCTDISFFYDGLQDKVDKLWSGESATEIYKNKLPSKVEYVCFGKLDATEVDENSLEMFSALKEEYAELPKIASVKNVFLYPLKTSCDAKLAYYEVKHAKIQSFFCVKNVKSSASLKLNKGDYDNFVNLIKP